MKKRVMQFFILLAIFVILLGTLHFIYFRGFTGYSVLNYSSLSLVNDGNFVDTSKREGNGFWYWLTIGVLGFLVSMYFVSFLKEHHRRTRKLPYIKNKGEPHLIELDLR